jgi:hypothetical protein
MRVRRLAFIAAASALLAAAPAPDLAAYRDHKRVVIVFAPDAVDPRLARQNAELDRLTRGPDDRDLVRVDVIGMQVTGASDSAERLHRRFNVARAGFRVVLVGKDGGAKLSSDQPLTAARLAALIDAMPMRQDEMRRLRR